MKILLEYGADVNLRNDDGRTALEEVLLQPSSRSHRVAQLLRQAGVVPCSTPLRFAQDDKVWVR